MNKAWKIFGTCDSKIKVRGTAGYRRKRIVYMLSVESVERKNEKGQRKIRLMDQQEEKKKRSPEEPNNLLQY